MASVVSNRPEIDAAFCNALRVTLVGSTTPAFTRSFVFAGGDVVTFVAFARLDFLHDERAFLARVIGELTERLFDRAAHDLHADLARRLRGP